MIKPRKSGPVINFNKYISSNPSLDENRKLIIKTYTSKIPCSIFTCSPKASIDPQKLINRIWSANDPIRKTSIIDNLHSSNPNKPHSIIESNHHLRNMSSENKFLTSQTEPSIAGKLIKSISHGFDDKQIREANNKKIIISKSNKKKINSKVSKRNIKFKRINNYKRNSGTLIDTNIENNLLIEIKKFNSPSSICNKDSSKIRAERLITDRKSVV